jgi:hypothetical protein
MEEGQSRDHHQLMTIGVIRRTLLLVVSQVRDDLHSENMSLK